jgi:STE24 endopeptidase
LPLNYFSEYVIEHKFGLSSECFFNWLKFKLKEFITVTALGMIFIVLFYFILFNFNYWWFIAFALFFLVSVLITFIFPKIISFFYTLEAIDNPEIQKSIKEIIFFGNLKLEGVYKIGLSKRTKKANAALTGIGKSKKVLISDTLLNSEAGIEGIKAVIAHEVGHYVKLHMNKLILIELFLNYFLFYSIYRMADYFINIFSYGTIFDLVNFPVLIFLFSVVNLFFIPVYNFFSRSFEYQADKYAADVVGKKNYIDMLNKLSEKNLTDKKPLRILEILFHSHPCIKKRIDALS